MFNCPRRVRNAAARGSFGFSGTWVISVAAVKFTTNFPLGRAMLMRYRLEVGRQVPAWVCLSCEPRWEDVQRLSL